MGGMRGSPDPQLAMLTSVSTEDLIPPDHPIRKIRVVVDAVLAELDGTFDGMYSAGVLRAAQLRPALQVVPGHAHRPAGVRRDDVHQEPRASLAARGG